MKKVKTIALGLIFTLCFSSCALMFNGTKKRVTIQSMMPKAKIYIDGEYALTGVDTTDITEGSVYAFKVE